MHPGLRDPGCHSARHGPPCKTFKTFTSALTYTLRLMTYTLRLMTPPTPHQARTAEFSHDVPSIATWNHTADADGRLSVSITGAGFLSALVNSWP